MEFDAINNHMTDTVNPTPSNQPKPPVARPNPNESTGLNIDEHVKIWDPNSKQVILEKRA